MNEWTSIKSYHKYCAIQHVTLAPSKGKCDKRAEVTELFSLVRYECSFESEAAVFRVAQSIAGYKGGPVTLNLSSHPAWTFLLPGCLDLVHAAYTLLGLGNLDGGVVTTERHKEINLRWSFLGFWWVRERGNYPHVSQHANERQNVFTSTTIKGWCLVSESFKGSVQLPLAYFRMCR